MAENGERLMRPWLRAVALAAAIFLLPAVGAMGQAPPNQIQLSESQIQGFIEAQKDLQALMQNVKGPSELSRLKLRGERDNIVKKRGFKDFAEFENIVANIALVMSGIDPKTKEFVEPPVLIKKQIEEVTADKTIPEGDRKRALTELNEALKFAQPVKHSGNIDLVKKHFDVLDKLLQ